MSKCVKKYQYFKKNTRDNIENSPFEEILNTRGRGRGQENRRKRWMKSF
jgi:hypothetical protein